jgi:hypothetical protein
MSPERMLVDCAATALEVIDASNGLVRTAQLFVGLAPFSWTVESLGSGYLF